MRHAIIAVLAALLLASTASAEELLFCADEGATGFVWDDKGNVQSTGFAMRRYTIRVVSESERWISKQGGSPVKYTCTNENGLYFCRDAFLPTPFIFGPNGYTRAYLAGTPLGGVPEKDPYILVSYGTCTKF